MAKYTPFGLKVQIEMLKQDTNIPKLSEQLGISRQYLLDILKGNRPGKKLIPTISKILGIGEDDQSIQKG